jgi:hypothetical protein
MGDIGRCVSLGAWLRERYGGPVRKLGVALGIPCPGGGRARCAFCDPAAFVPDWLHGPVTRQLEEGRRRSAAGSGATRFIPYFQDCTPTNCDPGFLRPLLEEAGAFPGAVGVALCTRPDCLPDEMLDMLADFARSVPLWVELGLQSASDATLERMGRGHGAGEAARAAEELRRRGIPSVLHVILGLPGETSADIGRTALFTAGTGAWGVKIHNLLILRGTALERDYLAGLVEPQTLEGHAALAAAFIRLLRPGTVIHRLAADAPAAHLVAPSWVGDATAVLRAVRALL